MVELWLDNVRIADLSGATTTVAAPVDGFQIGEAQGTNQIYDVVFDDAAFGTARLGPVADGAAPSVPGEPLGDRHLGVLGRASAGPRRPTTSASPATTSSATARSWQASATSRATPTRPSLASTTYSYTVRARDTSGNPSGLSAPASATTPAAPAADLRRRLRVG